MRIGSGKFGLGNLGLMLALNAVAAAAAAPLPGIHAISETETQFCLVAPGKAKVNLVGDFNNWSPSAANLMNHEGDRFYITLGGLTAGKEYVFQYWVDDNLKVGDPYAAKVVDFRNDPEIIADGTYPGLIPYTREFDGPATVFRAGLAAPSQPAPFIRPAAENLLIYEVLVRDFVKSHSFQEMKDSLAYFKRLGVNAIELMPVVEFENNDSWGYNSTFFMAVDKYYGPAETLKALIDTAHAMGLVVISDIVMNHAMGQAPIVNMWFDGTSKTPIANAPYANVSAMHPYSVGYDLNYESPYTMAYFKDMLRYWLKEYGFDGYRIDLSKGLTQKYTYGDVTAWNRMDPSRVRIIDTLAAAARQVSPDAYLILEHFADNDEEKLLSGQGFLLWGNAYYDFGGAMVGDIGKSFKWTYAKDGRAWGENHLVSYMESHDEERLMARAAAEGASGNGYTIKDFATALEREKLTALFFLGIPGPKQMWQYGEYGDERPRGPTDKGQQMVKKPMPDAWRTDAARLRLWNTWSALLHWRGSHASAFKDGAFTWKPDGAVRNWKLAQGDFTAYAVGNFGVNADKWTLPLSGTWYDFFSREKVELNGAGDLPLKAGEFHLLINKPEFAPVANITEFALPASLHPETVTVAIANPRPIRAGSSRQAGSRADFRDQMGRPRDPAGRLHHSLPGSAGAAME